jgi:hypothetical protein
MMDEPCESNAYLAKHVKLLADNYVRWTETLFPRGDEVMYPDPAVGLYHAPFVVLSHDTREDPIFNYANLAGQRLFEMSWQDFMVTPSRLSAEPLIRAERLRLFERVAAHGFIDDYRGVRVSRSRRRFNIDQATVWTLWDEQGEPGGQAAMFARWEFL